MIDLKLGKETDKAGNTVTIYQSLHLGMSPAFSLFLKHYHELIDSGYGFPVTTWDDDRCGILYAKKDNKIVGQITYDTKSPIAPGSLWIVLSSVDKDHRGLGIYKIMHKYADQIAKDLDCHSVSSLVHINNKQQLRALDSVGKKPVFYLVGKKF
jgi:RimJ/RimL family protein N-acetyltransferase